jgi:hypothetical protein
MTDQCPAQTETLNTALECNWPDGHAGGQHWDQAEGLLWSQPAEAPGVPPYRADHAAILRGAVADLHMAGIKTGGDYERLVGEVVSRVYLQPARLLTDTEGTTT